MKVCRVCNKPLTTYNWHKSLRNRNNQICKECANKQAREAFAKNDSTKMIHNIIDNHQVESNRDLMIRLNNLRRKVILETHSEIYRGLNEEAKIKIHDYGI